VAKRKPTSRPKAERGPQPPRKARGDARSGTTAARAPAEPRGPGRLARVWATTKRFSFLIVLVLAVGGGIALGIHQGNKADDTGSDETTSDATTTQPPFRSEQEAAEGEPVRDVFAHTCGTCHTLRRANVKGIVGPDLDTAVLTAAEVRRMIATGSLDTVMPKNLLVGEDADRVARYVARQSLASRRARARDRN
jgi:mono/diheme cytochrome c family protein